MQLIKHLYKWNLGKPFPDGSKTHLGPVLILVDHVTNLEMVILSAMCALKESFQKYILPPCSEPSLLIQDGHGLLHRPVQDQPIVFI